MTFYEFVYKDTLVHIDQGHLSHPEDADQVGELRDRRQSDATFATTRIGRFLSNRPSVSKEENNHIEEC